MWKVIIIVVLVAVALVHGYWTAETRAYKPTLGDTLLGVIRTPAGLICGLAILFVLRL